MSADDFAAPAGAPARVRRPYTESIDRRVSDAEADAAQLRSRVGAVSRGVVRASVLGVIGTTVS